MINEHGIIQKIEIELKIAAVSNKKIELITKFTAPIPLKTKYLLKYR
jgi:hypothetical protein